MNNSFRTLDDADFRGKRVLVRVDLNVPMENGKVILLAHFGRPKGGPDEANSLKSIAPVLSQHLGKPVAFAPDCIGKAAEAAIAKMRDGDILLLENTRFHKGEEKNDPAFVDALAELGDIYVNDAFSATHRAHASTEGLAHKLPAYAGRTMQAELEALGKALDNPVRPLMAVVGGAKISTKLELIGNLINKVDILAIGGGMANTFLAAGGKEIGKSLCEKDLLDTARSILRDAAAGSCRIVLPVDAA